MRRFEGISLESLPARCRQTPADLVDTCPAHGLPMTASLLTTADISFPNSASLLAQTAGGGLNQFILFGVVGAIFFFLVFLPQRRQEKQRQARLDAVKAGDEVVTRGGLLGKVHSTDEEGIISLQIASGTRVRVLRREITDLHQPSAQKPSGGPAKATPSAPAQSSK